MKTEEEIIADWAQDGFELRFVRVDSSDDRRPVFADLLDRVLLDYRVKGRRSIADLERRISKHIEPGVGLLAAANISEREITDYIVQRQKGGASNATINLELAVIRRAFNLAKRDIPNPPKIEMLPLDNERQTAY